MTSTERSQEDDDDEMKTILEGSAKMSFPKDEDTAVFYNPVQVQNRDLSTLMMTLYAERWAKRKAVTEKRKELRSKSVKGDELASQLNQYEQSLNVRDLLDQNNKKTDTNDNDESKNESNGERSVVGNGLHVLDALAASGLRSIRYWNEVPGIEHITINDCSHDAVQRAHHSLQQNNLANVKTTNRTPGIRIQQGDATHEMYTSRQSPIIKSNFKPKQTSPQQQQQQQQQMNQQHVQYDVIDLDPYGSSAPFLDAAVQAVKNGGMLNVTCTDMAALGGSHPETCFGRYAAMPIQRANYLHEVALRILLYALSTCAARHGRIVKPILSVGMDFYVRCFCEIHDSKAAVNDLSLRIGNVYQSTQCESFYTLPQGQMSKSGKKVYQPTRIPTMSCKETGAPFKVGGPMWLGPLHDADVVKEALGRLRSKDESSFPQLKWIATRARLEGLLTTVSEELLDVPLYYTLPSMCQTLGCTSPPLFQVKAALTNAGYRVSGYHKDPQAIKTNAPNNVLWDILRVWCQTHPPKRGKKKKKQQKNQTEASESPGAKILAIEPSIEVDFSSRKPRHLQQQREVARFPMNPEKNWGPKKAAPMPSKNNSGDDVGGNKRKLDTDTFDEATNEHSDKKGKKEES